MRAPASDVPFDEHAGFQLEETVDVVVCCCLVACRVRVECALYGPPDSSTRQRSRPLSSWNPTCSSNGNMKRLEFSCKKKHKLDFACLQYVAAYCAGLGVQQRCSTYSQEMRTRRCARRTRTLMSRASCCGWTTMAARLPSWVESANGTVHPKRRACRPLRARERVTNRLPDHAAERVTTYG